MLCRIIHECNIRVRFKFQAIQFSASTVNILLSMILVRPKKPSTNKKQIKGCLNSGYQNESLGQCLYLFTVTVPIDVILLCVHHEEYSCRQKYVAVSSSPKVIPLQLLIQQNCNA